MDTGASEVGPSLNGVFSRKAGELADFRYSPAMKRSGVTWTAETLDKLPASRRHVQTTSTTETSYNSSKSDMVPPDRGIHGRTLE